MHCYCITIMGLLKGGVILDPQVHSCLSKKNERINNRKQCILGALLVTTPQQTSLQVTRRGANMFQKLNVPIIGIVENMSYIKCPSCSSTVDLFGSGTESFATEIGCKILQKIPLLQTITESGDKGVPVVVADPENEQSLVYKKLARDVTGYLREKRG